MTEHVFKLYEIYPISDGYGVLLPTSPVKKNAKRLKNIQFQEYINAGQPLRVAEENASM